MNILGKIQSTPLFCILAILLNFSVKSYAGEERSNTTSEKSSGWFLGGALNSLCETDIDTVIFNCPATNVGFQVHGGYQFYDFLQIFSGVEITNESINKTKKAFVKLRPRWVFDNDFFVYSDIAFNLRSKVDRSFTFPDPVTGEIITQTISRGTDSLLSVGIGVGYLSDQHEFDFGFEGDNDYSFYYLQYNYYF